MMSEIRWAQCTMLALMAFSALSILVLFPVLR